MLEGRRAIVTGASRGIGAEIAQTMARAGAAVVLAARDQLRSRRSPGRSPRTVVVVFGFVIGAAVYWFAEIKPRPSG